MLIVSSTQRSASRARTWWNLGVSTRSRPLETAQNLLEALPAATDLITRVPHPAGGTGPIGRAVTCVAVPEQVAVGLDRQHLAIADAQNLSEALPAATDLITRVPHPAGGTGPIGRAVACGAVAEQVAVGLDRQHLAIADAQNLSEALPAATDLITRVPHPAGGTGPIGRAITCIAVPEQVAVGLDRQH